MPAPSIPTPSFPAPQLPRGASLNISGGILVTRLAVAKAGGIAAVPSFVHSGRSPATSEFGYGWSCTLKRKLETITGPPDRYKIDDGTGTVLYFANEDAQGRLQPPAGTLNSLVHNLDGTWTETKPDGFQFRYNSSGQFTKMVSSSGGIWTVGYDATRVSYVEDPLNRRTTLVYDGSSKILRVEDPTGRITTFSVDVSGDLVMMTTPELCQTEFRYFNDHRIKAHIDPEGGRTSYTYDARGWVASVTPPAGGRMTFTPLDWSTTKITDAAGNSTTILYNVARNVSGTIDPMGSRATYLWTGNNLTTYVDGRGYRTTFTYVTLNNRTQKPQAIIDSAGGRFTYLYDGQDRLQTMVDQLARRTTFVWDNNNRRTAIVDATGVRTSFVYNSIGQITATINPLLNRWTQVYDALGQLSAEVNPLEARTTYTYERGQRRTVRNPLNYVTTYARDLMNRITAEINPVGARTTFIYDSNGRLTETISPIGARTTNIYDATGRLKVVIEPMEEQPQIMNDGGPFFTTIGTWLYGSGYAYFLDGDVHAAVDGGGANKAIWQFTVTAGKTYRVFATWVGNPFYATNSPYTVYDGATPFTTVRVNQSQTPQNDLTEAGVIWQILGDYTITGTVLKVELNDYLANGYVQADGIRIALL